MIQTDAKANGTRPRVCFLFIAQTHQILHSLPIAVALARGWPDVEVEIAATTAEHLDYVRGLLAQLGGAPITSRLLPPSWLRNLRLKGASTPPKALMLAANAQRLGRYDAVVTPERTTALLRKLGVKDCKLVYTQHGAGDRGGPFEPRLKAFDLVMAAGPKQYDRMIAEGWVTPPDLRHGRLSQVRHHRRPARFAATGLRRTQAGCDVQPAFPPDPGLVAALGP